MATFLYEGISRSGEAVSGSVDAGFAVEAVRKLRDLNVLVSKVRRICEQCRAPNALDAAACEHCSAALPAAAMGLAEADEARIIESLSQGRKIEAIKAYRDATGAGLREAKLAVESTAQALGLPAGQASGCVLSAALLLGLLSLALGRMVLR